MKKERRKIAVFASGNGTNAENIFQYFKEDPEIEVTLLLCNKSKAFVIERAKKHEIPSLVFNRETFYKTDDIVQLLQAEKIDLLVLAGFMWLLPENLVRAFSDKIVNIHPALLPKYGGKGMYGAHVHQAVIDNKEKESGITIHFVNRNYDEGRIIRQESCPVTVEDTPETLAGKIQQLEHHFYPKVIADILRK